MLRQDKIKNRIWELDFLRGVCILLMVMDHTFFDIGFIFNTAWAKSGNESIINFIEFARNYWTTPLRVNTREIVIWTLFMICGISNSFSRSNLKRGLQLMGIALIFTLVTVNLQNNYESFSGMAIRFGVLHMLASCILVWCVVDFIFRDKYRTAAACFVLAVVTLIFYKNMDSLTVGYSASNNTWGFIHDNLTVSVYSYSPGDYFPLLPNLGIFMLGAAIAPVLYNKRRTLLPWLDKYRWYRPINFFGRHTLEIVVLHQPLINLILALISYIFITKGDWVII